MTTNSLIAIVAGSKANSADLNSNFNYLDNRITQEATSIRNDVSSSISGLSSSAVKKTGDETISGTKTYSGTLKVTGTLNGTSGTVTVKTQATTDNSTKAASTAFVRSFAINNIAHNWVHTSEQSRGSSTTKSSSVNNPYVISLRNYLPQDNQYYEIYVHAYMKDTSRAFRTCRIYSSTFGTTGNTVGYGSFGQLVCGDYADYCVNDFVLPVKANGNVLYYLSDNVDDLEIRFFGYRKLGVD